jgi:O-antigen/teichoic acid export membrane protein
VIKRILKSSLVRSSGIYTISRIVNSAIPFLMMPVLTRYLSPTDYGIVAMFAVLLGIVSPFVGLSLHGAVSVRYFDKSETDLPRYIGNCFMILVASAFLVSVVMWLFAGPISRHSAFPREWLWTVVFVAAAQFVGFVLMTLWQVENKPVRYGIFQNLQTLGNVSLTILLVVGLGKNWQGRIEAQVITLALFALVAGYILYRNGWLKFSYDRSSVNNALRFGIPLIPHALGGMLIVQTDRMFLTNMAGVAVAGIYTVGYQFGSIIDMVASSFNQAYAPWLYKQLNSDDPAIKKRIVKLTYLYFVLILFFAVGLSLIVPWFLTFFVGKNFVGAGKYVFWIALGYAFNGMYYMVTNYIFFAGKTSVLAGVTFLTALLNIAFNYLLIKLNGPVGAAQASALAFFISFILTWVLSARVYAMPWSLKRTGYNAA